MANTLRQQMDAETSAVFLNANEFAENATHFVGGSPTGSGATIKVIIDRDNETNSGTGHGDAAMIDDSRGGSEIKRAIRLEMLASIAVIEEGQAALPSLFLLADGSYCRAVRVIGKDPELQTVLCVELDRRSSGHVEQP